MRILMDQDGPLADFDALYFERCAEAGIALDISSVDEQRHRFATDHVLHRHQRRQARHLVERTRWFRDLPLVEGAAEGMAALAEVADVWICTKPMEANDFCRDDKARWVAEHLGPEWARKLIITPDKSLVAGDILLDDAPRHDWFDQASWTPVVFARPWNGDGSKWEGLPRWSWDQPIEDLLALA